MIGGDAWARVAGFVPLRLLAHACRRRDRATLAERTTTCTYRRRREDLVLYSTSRWSPCWMAWCLTDATSTQHLAPSTQHPAPSTQHPVLSTQYPAYPGAAVELTEHQGNLYNRTRYASMPKTVYSRNAVRRE
jgi:hypothetical protein